MPIYPRELKECQNECDLNSKCNAIEYADKESYCAILECIHPVPKPTSDTALSNIEMREDYPDASFDYVAYSKGIFILHD